MSDPPSSLERTRGRAHPDCVFCSPHAGGGLAIRLSEDGSGGVQGTFACVPTTQGYPGLVHGGVASGLLDAAMTNALFLRGVAGLTARLQVRYRRPLRLARTATVAARATARRGAWWIVHGEIRQDGVVAATAEAWFRDRREPDAAEAETPS